MPAPAALPDETEVLYISPLKALSNDVRRNLQRPLAEITELAAEKGIALAPIRTAVRTGDTPMSERRQMIRTPPHVLVTTPESLFILVTAGKSREMLMTVRTAIVDEIHAMADDKRGSHLARTLARLGRFVNGPVRKIGLSATVRPIEKVARCLSPNAGIVDVGHRRAMDIGIEVPNDELSSVANSEMWAEIYDRIARHIREHRTTLVFVNTRRLSERVAHALTERLGAGVVLPHHGSLARRLRLDAESRLKGRRTPRSGGNGIARTRYRHRRRGTGRGCGKVTVTPLPRASPRRRRIVAVKIAIVAMLGLFGVSRLNADFAAGLVAYERGDHAGALREWRPLAEKGEAASQFNLGLLYYEGQGVPQDYESAANWFQKSADQGYAKAQLNLGAMYGTARGVRRDYQQAYMWLSLCAASGDSKCTAQRDLVAQKLKPDKLSAAQRAARDWKRTAPPQ